MIKSQSAYTSQPSAPMQNSFGKKPAQNPYQQSSQPQQTQQQASPYKATDMSAYAQPQSPYNASNVPRTPPKGAQVNDLSGNVPSNQIYAQAYNQAQQQSGGKNRATSFTMPGSYTSQSYNPQTGVYGPQTGGQSFDGNMAYNAIDNRPGPMTATSSFNGQQMGIQDTFDQRMAFAGNLSDRLNQYSGGQLTGPVTIDQDQLMRQASDQLANGTFVNPLTQQDPFTQAYNQMNPGAAAYSPDIQRAMNNSSQFFQGSQPFQNPLGGNQYNNPVPSWNQQSYNPTPQMPGQSSFEQFLNDRGLMNDYNTWNSGRQPTMPPERPFTQPTPPARPQSQPRTPQPTTGTRSPQFDTSSYLHKGAMPNGARAATIEGDMVISEEWMGTEAFESELRKKGVQFQPSQNPLPGRERKTQPPSTQSLTRAPQGTPGPAPQVAPTSRSPSTSARPIAPAATGEKYDPANASPSLPPAPTSVKKTDTQADLLRQTQVSKIEMEIAKWQQATYGTRTGGGPPPEWASHIKALQRLKAKAEKGDPAALAWSPKMQAPAPHRTSGAGESMGFKNKKYTQEAGNARVRS